mgnify:CR=1 FL=1
MINLRKRTFRLILIAVALTAMVLLSAGLSNVTLDEGIPFSDLWAFLVSEFRDGLFVRPEMSTIEADGLVRLIQILYFIGLASFPLVVVLIIVSPELRKRVIRMLIQFALIALALSLFTRNRGQVVENEEGFQSPTEISPPTAGEISSITEEFQSQVSEPIVWGASLVLALLIAGIVIYIVSQMRKSRPTKSSLESLATRAESAAEDIRRGGSFRDTILRCYADMNRIVRDQRGIQRETSLTAREFVESLVKAGLPEKPVQELTALFEEVRYGHKAYSEHEAQLAVNSLQTIARACRNPT